MLLNKVHFISVWYFIVWEFIIWFFFKNRFYFSDISFRWLCWDFFSFIISILSLIKVIVTAWKFLSAESNIWDHLRINLCWVSYFWRMNQLFLFWFCYDVGFFIFASAKNLFGWPKLQTLSLSSSSNHSLVPLVLSWFPCQPEIYLSSVYTQKRGLSSLSVSLLGCPVPANLISSHCGCSKLCTVVLQANKTVVFCRRFCCLCKWKPALRLKFMRNRKFT